MLDSTEDAMKNILLAMLEYYGKPELMEAIYTAVKELAINAVKANMKRVVFQQNRLDINKPEDADQGHQLFKQRLESSGRNMAEFAREAREMGYSVLLDFIPEKDCLLIEIRNNALISRDENTRLRSKLAKSMTYEDIAQFYMDFADNTEGAGLGMTMITVMLRQNEIDPHCFTIFNDDIYTIARLEVPMSPDYVPRRRRYKRSLGGM